MALVCRKCERTLQDDEMPDDPRVRLRCPACSCEAFVAAPDPPRPKPWRLTHNDRQMLKKLKIRHD